MGVQTAGSLDDNQRSSLQGIKKFVPSCYAIVKNFWWFKKRIFWQKNFDLQFPWTENELCSTGWNSPKNPCETGTWKWRRKRQSTNSERAWKTEYRDKFVTGMRLGHILDRLCEKKITTTLSNLFINYNVWIPKKKKKRYW